MSDNNNNSGQPAQSQNSDTQGQSASQNSSQEPPNPFAGIPIDDLPDDVRASITKAQEAYNKNLADAKTIQQQKDAAEQSARFHQSRADKFGSVLQRHNLSVDGNQQQQQASQEDLLVQQLVKDGLKEDAARGYAKMLVANNTINNSQLLSSIAPLAQTVAGVQATQLLQQATLENPNIFGIVDIAKQVRDNVDILLTQGKTVDQPTIQHLTEMAYGKYAMQNPTKVNAQNQNANNRQQVPQFGGGMMTGAVPNQTQNQQRQGPTATQPETITIMDALNAEMRRGLPKNKK